MPLLGAANLSLNKAHDRGRQCNSKARADICKQLLARASLDYSPNPPGGWDLARSRVFSQAARRGEFFHHFQKKAEGGAPIYIARV